MNEVKITINGQERYVPEDFTLLMAAKQGDVFIPTLCHSELLEVAKGGACRLCVVEVEGRNRLLPACATTVWDGMVIHTDTERVIKSRKLNLELLLANHPLDCLTCEKAGDCRLQDYCYEYHVKTSRFAHGQVRNLPMDTTNRFYTYEPNKCILCGNCVRVCHELQKNGAIGRSLRGFVTHVTTPFEDGLEASSCVSCGNCIAVCPVGALTPKSKVKYRTWDVKRVKTTCPYCGVGCQMDLLIKGQQVVGVEPRHEVPNQGLLCVKGKFGYGFINHPDRLTSPLIKKNGTFEEASWEEAFALIVKQVKTTKEAYGSEAFAGLSSARCTNEENYLFQKFMRAVLGTNNVDHCARLCHASTVAGLATTLGSGAMTNSIEEVLGADVIFVTGSNTTETHPVIGAFMKQAKDKGAKIIVAEPRRIELAEEADVFLQIKPGTNVALFNGMMHVIIKEGLMDQQYRDTRTENFEALEKTVASYNPKYVADICGVCPEDIEEATRLYARADKAGIFYSMGVTQHTTGTHGVMATSNLALLCGNIGKASAGVNPLRGQNNVQGACDLGALPGDLPGYQKVYHDHVIDKFETHWGKKLPHQAGLTVTEMMKKGEEGAIKFLYVMGENPMISDPDINHVKKALETIDFIVVQDIFLTETALMADVILPAASFAEKEGTFTNTERRIQRVRKAINPIGNSKPDWVIIMNLMHELEYPKTYNHPSEIMEEIAALTPIYGGITYERIEQEGLQWPCPTKEHPGTVYLHKDTCMRGLGLFKPADYMESAEVTDADYPYILTTGRMLYHFHTKTMTGRVEAIQAMYPHSFIQINPTTANRLGLKDGDRVQVTSRRGQVITTASITDIVEEDVCFMPFHFADGAANYLTNTAVDPIAKIPELKVSAVRLEKVLPPIERCEDV